VQKGRRAAAKPARESIPLISSARTATALSGRQLFRRTTREIIHKFLTANSGVYTKVAMELWRICDFANISSVKSKKRENKRQICAFIKGLSKVEADLPDRTVHSLCPNRGKNRRA
jgi:hypothetical protein